MGLFHPQFVGGKYKAGDPENSDYANRDCPLDLLNLSYAFHNATGMKDKHRMEDIFQKIKDWKE